MDPITLAIAAALAFAWWKQRGPGAVAAVSAAPKINANPIASTAKAAVKIGLKPLALALITPEISNIIQTGTPELISNPPPVASYDNQPALFLDGTRNTAVAGSDGYVQGPNGQHVMTVAGTAYVTDWRGLPVLGTDGFPIFLTPASLPAGFDYDWFANNPGIDWRKYARGPNVYPCNPALDYARNPVVIHKPLKAGDPNGWHYHYTPQGPVELNKANQPIGESNKQDIAEGDAEAANTAKIAQQGISVIIAILKAVA